MRDSTATYYAMQADAQERDPIIIPGEHGRADVASGRLGKAARFHNVNDLIWLDTPDGQTIFMTRKQLDALQAIRRLADTGVRVTMRHLAELLGQAPSTVSRTAVKLAAYGFIAYQANRGRNGGTVWVLRRGADTLDWFREEAKAKVRAWAQRTKERFDRLRMNVAAIYPMRESELSRSTYSTDRNIKLRAWTPDELREAGIL
jgi:DNA-binding MarR family transcriptional regulator